MKHLIPQRQRKKSRRRSGKKATNSNSEILKKPVESEKSEESKKE
jgi:hypothetical protein